ncbi:hypothetical protein FA13DRAFT_1122083 [Coprinellus micaceus]|uniref:Uncharacterized protein n=1 Tax=Coprinellus micaceus TaxID=71717 RepID=A0A4Y7SW58_COPMI|nr:hypothetical protein FA13DRAFT_1122083 [Coprinellus micaceus]
MLRTSRDRRRYRLLETTEARCVTQRGPLSSGLKVIVRGAVLDQRSIRSVMLWVVKRGLDQSSPQPTATSLYFWQTCAILIRSKPLLSCDTLEELSKDAEWMVRMCRRISVGMRLGEERELYAFFNGKDAGQPCAERKSSFSASLILSLSACRCFSMSSLPSAICEWL